MISVYGGTGFIGSNFLKLFPDNILISKEDKIPKTNDVLYLISTVDNYNVYSDPYIDIKTNLIHLIEVLEKCKDNKNITFNFISSWFVYGKIEEIPAKETSICNPTGFYSITKYTAEKMLASYCETFGINYRILRLTNIIGKNDSKVCKKKNALQYMINRLKNNQDVYLYNNGNIVRDYMHVYDCCRAIKLCLDYGPNKSIINISNSEPVKIGDIIHYCKNKLKSVSNIIPIEPPEFHKIVQIENMYLDNTNLLKLGYTPKYTVYDTVDELIKD